MNTRQRRVVRAAINARVPVLLMGLPGIGKTSELSQIADELDALLEVVIGSIREPADFLGLPVPHEGTVHIAPPSWVERVNAAQRALVLIDELTSAPLGCQSAMLRMVLERVAGDVAFHDGVAFVAAANPADIAADGSTLSAPLANRFLHMNISIDPSAWVEGMANGWTYEPPSAAELQAWSPSHEASVRAEVVAFIKHQPQHLLVMPDDAEEAGMAWPSPRSWEMLARVMAHLPAGDLAAQTLAAHGCVGKAAAVAFQTWRDNASLPDPETVLDDPSCFDFAERPDRTFAVLTAIATVVAADNSKARWNKAWKVMAACANTSAADVAASAARSLLANRPSADTELPKEANAFLPVLTAAGMVA